VQIHRTLEKRLRRPKASRMPMGSVTTAVTSVMRMLSSSPPQRPAPGGAITAKIAIMPVKAAGRRTVRITGTSEISAHSSPKRATVAATSRTFVGSFVPVRTSEAAITTRRPPACRLRNVKTQPKAAPMRAAMIMAATQVRHT
jgi:hypothetical protein